MAGGNTPFKLGVAQHHPRTSTRASKNAMILARSNRKSRVAEAEGEAIDGVEMNRVGDEDDDDVEQEDGEDSEDEEEHLQQRRGKAAVLYTLDDLANLARGDNRVVGGEVVSTTPASKNKKYEAVVQQAASVVFCTRFPRSSMKLK